MQMNEKVCKRSACVLLIAMLLLALFPTTIIPAAHSTESGSSGPYGANIGHTAWFNLDFYSTFLVFTHPADFDYFGSDGEFDFDSSDNDGSDWDNDAYWLNSESFNEDSDIPEDHLLVITNSYWDSATTALWYKVEAAPGYELPAKMAENGYVWVYQNFTDVYSDRDWKEYSPDSLVIGDSAFTSDRTPLSVVSENGIIVSSDHVQLAQLTVTEAEVPADYFINRAIAYNMTLKTSTGDYTEYAEVTIPIPEDWDTSKLFGFVVEEDGSLSVLSGTVTKHGTFRFTVPHFSEVGLLEATAVEDVKNVTITFGRVRQENILNLPGQVGEAGRHVSDDGNVQYVINHVTSNGTTTTYITFMGLDVTAGTEIILGDVSVVAIVNKATANMDVLLTGGSLTNSAKLNPLYDLIISGDFDVDYTIAAGEDTVGLEGNVITANAANGSATVVADVKHPVSHKVVGTVTYDVTITDTVVDDVKNLYIPKGGTVQIKMNGTSIVRHPDETIATAELADGTLSVTALQDHGETSVLVDNVLFRVFAEPVNTDPEQTASAYIYVKVKTVENTTIYYAINGGDLHRATGMGLLIGQTEMPDGEGNQNASQTFPDGINLMFFSAPNKGYATSKYEAQNANQFYSLVDGSRYDGSDSAAWPFVDTNANYDASNMPASGSDAWKKDTEGNRHGFRWCLIQQNMTIAQMRDLFTRALALGCDSAINFTKNTGETYVTDLEVSAESMPTFEKTIVGITRKESGIVETFSEQNPYDPNYEDPLMIGDEVTYQFKITIPSTLISYEFTLKDSAIELEDVQIQHTVEKGIVTNNAGGNIVCTQTDGVHIYTVTQNYVIGMTDGAIDGQKISQYAEGKFTNSAELTYSYKSDAASGQTKTVATSSVTCSISSIVTWKDNLGEVWYVANVLQGGKLPTESIPVKTRDGYYPCQWNYDTWVTSGNLIHDADGSYQVNYGANSSITIAGNWEPITYNITYDLDQGTWPNNATYPQTYTIQDFLTLPIPEKTGHTFTGWKVSAAEGEAHNWSTQQSYAGGMVVPRRFGNVTLTAQWQVNSYTITFNTDGGSTVPSITQNYGTKIEAPTNPTKDGFVFAGWSPELPDTMPAENLTVVAQWAVGFTSLTIQVDGCQNIDENQTFLFRIAGNGIDLVVTVHGNSSAKIEGLQIGKTYTVTQLTGWSWRYDAPTVSSESAGISYTPVTGGAEVTITGQNVAITFNQSRKENKWLDGNSWLDNWFQQN